MKSTTLSKSKFFSVFEILFKRSLPVTIICSVFASLVTAASLQIALFSLTWEDKTGGYNITTSLYGVFMMAAALSVVSSAVSISLSFKEAFTKRGADFFFAVPVKRKTYINASYAVALAGSIINFAAPALVMLIYTAVRFNFNIKVEAGALLSFAAALILVVLFSISLCLFCVSISGKVSQYLMFFSMMNLIGYLFSAIMYSVNYVWGFWHEISSVSVIFSPLGALTHHLKMFDIEESILFVAVSSGVQAVIFFVLAHALFKKRKSEIAEMTVSGTVFPLALITLFQAAIIMCITLIGYDDLKVTAIVSIVLALIGTLALALKWFPREKAKYSFISLAAVAVLCCAFILVTKNVSFASFEKYVPEENEVKSVEIAQFSDYSMDGVISQYVTSESDERGIYNFESDEAINAVIAVHQKAANGEFDRNAYPRWNVRITYTLEGGRKVTRRYSLPTQYFIDEYSSLMQTYEAISQSKPCSIKNEDILFVEYNDYRSDARIYRLDDYSELQQAILIDYKNQSLEDFKEHLSFSDGGFILPYYNVYYSMVDYETDVLGEPEKYLINQRGTLTFYTVGELADDKKREMLFKLSPEQIVEYYNGYGEVSFIDYTTVAADSFEVMTSDKNTINYLKNAAPVN